MFLTAVPKDLKESKRVTTVASEETFTSVGRVTVQEVIRKRDESPPQESQVEDNDVWFRLFDRLPYKAVYKPQGMHPPTH